MFRIYIYNNLYMYNENRARFFEKVTFLQTMTIMLITLSLFESYSSTSCEKKTLKHLIVGKATLALPFLVDTFFSFRVI